MAVPHIRYKVDVFVFLLIAFAPSIRLSLADMSDESLPGHNEFSKKIFKRLLANYNPFQSPNPNKVINVTTRCFAESSFSEEDTIFSIKGHLMMRWTDKRLAWTSSQFSRRYAITFKNINRLWIPTLKAQSIKFDNTAFFVKKTGYIGLTKRIRFGIVCKRLKEYVYPYNRKRCYLYMTHSPDYRIVCGNKYGLECCLNAEKFAATSNESMWKLLSLNHTYTRYKTYYVDIMYYKIQFDLVRKSAENHYYISPPLIVGIMSAFQCLISLSNSRRYLVIFFLIYSAYDCVIASMSVKIIRIGNEHHLVNLCAFTLLANMIYLVWSCLSISLSRTGGVSSSILKIIVEKADRYRFFLLLPSHVEIAESSEKSESATWNYFCLLMDRFLFVVWIVAFATLANSVI